MPPVAGRGEGDEAVVVVRPEEEAAEAPERPAAERGTADAGHGAVLVHPEDRRPGPEADEEVRVGRGEPGATGQDRLAGAPRRELVDDEDGAGRGEPVGQGGGAAARRGDETERVTEEKGVEKAFVPRRSDERLERRERPVDRDRHGLHERGAQVDAGIPEAHRGDCLPAGRTGVRTGFRIGRAVPLG